MGDKSQKQKDKKAQQKQKVVEDKTKTKQVANAANTFKPLKK